MPPIISQPLSRAVISHSARLSLSTTPSSSGLIRSILHGAPDAQDEITEIELQHSRIVGRNKYIHEVIHHHVKPDRVAEYRALIGGYYPAIVGDEANAVKLSGSWEVTVGEQIDTFSECTGPGREERRPNARSALPR